MRRSTCSKQRGQGPTTAPRVGASRREYAADEWCSREHEASPQEVEAEALDVRLLEECRLEHARPAPLDESKKDSTRASLTMIFPNDTEYRIFDGEDFAVPPSRVPAPRAPT